MGAFDMFGSEAYPGAPSGGTIYDYGQSGGNPFGDPKTAALLGLAQGLLAAGAPHSTPVGLGGALGQGIGGALTGAMNATQMNQRQALVDLEQQKLKQAQAQFAMQQGLLRSILPDSGGTSQGPSTAASGGTDTPPGMSPTTSTALFGTPEYATPPASSAPQSPVQSPQQFPFNLSQVTAMKLAGLPDLTGAYNASQPNAMTVDTGNEIRIVDKRNPNQVYARLPKGAAPGAVPYEASDIPAGNYRDFLLSKARAGAVNINTQVPASEAAQKDFMDKTSKNYDALRTAPVLVQNIEKAKSLAGQENPFLGSFGTQKAAVAQFFNNNLGTNIAPDQIADAGELKNRLFQQIMDNLKKMDAQPSQMQQQMMQDALGNLNSDPKALQKILGVTEEIVRGKVDLHNKEVKSAIDRGVKFPYDPIIQMPAANKVPRFNPQTGKIER